MFNVISLILLTLQCWPYASARHLMPANYHRSMQQQPYYLPYSDYGYTYSGPPPYQPPYNQPFQQPYHSSLYSPPGTYYDQRRGILRPFPGGGVPVLVDYHKRCSNNYVGLKAHPDQNQYYYVCKPDCVIFGKCQNLQIFNNTSGQCIQHPPPEYLPTCTAPGRFPLFSDCHLYYKCEEDLQPKIYSCPAFMVFSPASKKCISGNKCTPTQISPNSAYMPEYCANKFPPCYENGTFRSPSDCSLYYKCELQKNAIYLQTRLRCPSGQFYDLQKEECLPSSEVPCDCIQVAELVYPKPNGIPYQPAVYPAQFDFDSLEENLYPVEFSQEELSNNCVENETKSTNDLDNEDNPTTLLPVTSDTTLNTEEVEEKDDSEVVVLSDYVDLGDPKAESEEIPDASATTISSEETTSIEGSGTTEADSAETLKANITEESASITEEDEPSKENITNENEVETATTTVDSSEEITDEPENLDKELEIKEEEPKKEETTTTSTTVFALTDLPSSSSTAEPCENIIGNDQGNDKPLPTDISDIHLQNETQSHTCLPKLTTANLIESDQTTNTLDSDFTRDSRSTLHEQNLTTINTQTPTITTQLPTTKTIGETENLETEKSLEEDFTFTTEKDNLKEDLESNLLDSEANLETAETTRSSEKTTPVLEETTHKPIGDVEILKEDDEFEDLVNTTKLVENSQQTTEHNLPETTQKPMGVERNLNEEDDELKELLDTTELLENVEQTTEGVVGNLKEEDDEVKDLLDTTELLENVEQTTVEDSSSGEHDEDNSLNSSISEEAKGLKENDLENLDSKLQTDFTADEIPTDNSLSTLDSVITMSSQQPRDATENEMDSETFSGDDEVLKENLINLESEITTTSEQTIEVTEIKLDSEQKSTKEAESFDFTSKQPREITESELESKQPSSILETSIEEHEDSEENSLNLKSEITTTSKNPNDEVENELNLERESIPAEEEQNPEENSLNNLEPDVITTTKQSKDEVENELELKSFGSKLSSLEEQPTELPTSTKPPKDITENDLELEAKPSQPSLDTTTFTLIIEKTTLPSSEQTTTTELPPTPSTTLNPPADETTKNSWNLKDDELGLIDREINNNINNFEATTDIAEENLDTNTLQDNDSSSANSQERKPEKLVTLREADFQEEELLPVHGKTATDFDYITDNFVEDTTDIIYNDDDYTTITADQETTTLASDEDQKQTLETQHATALKRRQTSNDESTQTTATNSEKSSTTDPTSKEDLNSNDLDSYEDELGVLDSEIVLQSDEVSNNVITSDETTKQTTIDISTTERQQFPHTHSTTISTTQTPTTTPNYTTITNTTPLSIETTTDTTKGPCKKHLDSVVLKVRDDAPSLSNSSSSSLPSKSLYYILKSKPVINTNNVNNSKNELVAAPPCGEENSDEIPRLEIIAERPIDVHFSICPSTCDKDHKHKFEPSSSRAVFLRWFAKKSKQTLALETVNDVESAEKKDC